MRRLDSKYFVSDVDINSRGFTLIEVLISISIFSLLILIAYQALSLTAVSKQTIANESTAQSELRSAHRLLSNLMRSGASINGEAQQMVVDLGSASTAWLAGSETLFLGLSEAQDLFAEIDNEAEQSVLLYGLDSFRFRYFDRGEFSDEWRSQQAPSAVILNWERDGEVYEWWFKRS